MTKCTTLYTKGVASSVFSRQEAILESLGIQLFSTIQHCENYNFQNVSSPLQRDKLFTLMTILLPKFSGNWKAQTPVSSQKLWRTGIIYQLKKRFSWEIMLHNLNVISPVEFLFTPPCFIVLLFYRWILLQNQNSTISSVQHLKLMYSCWLAFWLFGHFSLLQMSTALGQIIKVSSKK